MAKPATHQAAIPNPKLKPLGLLVGDWNVAGSHPDLQGTQHGHVAFEWLEGGAFLSMYTDVTEPGVPTSIAIIGSDDDAAAYYMLYFDERGVSRKYEMSLQDNLWKMWRNAPGFSQRFTGTFEDNGDTIIGVWELSEDDVTWKRDLELTYRRVK